MGVAAMRYRMRRIFESSQAENELEFYHQPEDLLWPRPCWCEWAHLQDRLLGHPEREGLPCACAGPVNFNVPGYHGRWGLCEQHRMRRFAESRLTAEYCRDMECRNPDHYKGPVCRTCGQANCTTVIGLAPNMSRVIGDRD